MMLRLDVQKVLSNMEHNKRDDTHLNPDDDTEQD